jgi:hypothetical protein
MIASFPPRTFPFSQTFFLMRGPKIVSDLERAISTLPFSLFLFSDIFHDTCLSGKPTAKGECKYNNPLAFPVCGITLAEFFLELEAL